jgi:transcriptional regulator GlxA family with amidase domain
MDRLSKWGAEPIQNRIVESGKIITSAGVSAGIDLALTLAKKISGEQVAKTIQATFFPASIHYFQPSDIILPVRLYGAHYEHISNH